MRHSSHCCPEQRCADADADRSMDASTLFELLRRDPYVQLRTRTCLTEFVHCTFATNTNKAVIFGFLVTVLTWCETPRMCLLLLILGTGDVN